MISRNVSSRLPSERWIEGSQERESATSSDSFRRAQTVISEVSLHPGLTRTVGLPLGTDAGFTLIELMVVLLIMAILLAIAIPTFLGVTKSANDKAAQSNLNTALVNAKAQYQVNGQVYPTTANLLTSLTSAEPNLGFVSTSVVSTTTPSQVSVYVDPSATASLTGQGLIIAAQAKGGNCWYIIDNAVAETSVAAGYGNAATGFPVTQGTWYGEAKGAATCSAAAPLAAAANSVVYQQQSFPNLP